MIVGIVVAFLVFFVLPLVLINWLWYMDERYWKGPNDK